MGDLEDALDKITVHVEESKKPKPGSAPVNRITEIVEFTGQKIETMNSKDADSK